MSQTIAVTPIRGYAQRQFKKSFYCSNFFCQSRALQIASYSFKQIHPLSWFAHDWNSQEVDVETYDSLLIFTWSVKFSDPVDFFSYRQTQDFRTIHMRSKQTVGQYCWSKRRLSLHYLLVNTICVPSSYQKVKTIWWQK